MPKSTEFYELKTYCTFEWTSDPVNGCTVTGTNDNSIFLPAAGYFAGAAVEQEGEEGRYLCSTPLITSEGLARAYMFTFYLTNSDNTFYSSLGGNSRYHGRPVRAVCDIPEENSVTLY